MEPRRTRSRLLVRARWCRRRPRRRPGRAVAEQCQRGTGIGGLLGRQVSAGPRCCCARGPGSGLVGPSGTPHSPPWVVRRAMEHSICADCRAR